MTGQSLMASGLVPKMTRTRLEWEELEIFLLVAVSDAALGQVIRGHLQGHTIAG